MYVNPINDWARNSHTRLWDFPAEIQSHKLPNRRQELYPWATTSILCRKVEKPWKTRAQFDYKAQTCGRIKKSVIRKKKKEKNNGRKKVIFSTLSINTLFFFSHMRTQSDRSCLELYSVFLWIPPVLLYILKYKS